jgi:HAD superfamily hydrolase (TIGR01509 family)
MIKAVIFDFFGVLAARDSVSFRQTYYPNDTEKIGQEKKLLEQLGLGELSYDDYISGLAKIGGVSREEVLKYSEDYRPNQELTDYIRDKLKPKYKLGIISNAGADWVLKIIGDSKKLFDDILLSYEVGLIKPESEIYLMSTRNLGVKPEECIFIDDVLSFCQGAEVVGMNTIWYKNFEQFKEEIEKILGSTDD